MRRTVKPYLIAAVLAGAGLTPLALTSASPAAAAIVPPPPGAIVVGTASPTCHSPAFSTISAAVAAATANSVIYVCAGTYNESVTITKNLTLLGAQWGVPATGRLIPSQETIVTSATNDFTYGGSVTSGTINGFTIQGLTGNIRGILVSTTAGTGFTWVNNIITDTGLAIAVSTTGTTPTTINGNAITDNENGIFFNGPVSNAAIDHNKFFNTDDIAIETLGADSPSGPFSQHLSIVGNTSVDDSEFLHLILAHYVQVQQNRMTWLDPTSEDAGPAIYVDAGTEYVSIGQNIIDGGDADGIGVSNEYFPGVPPDGITIVANTIARRADGIHINPSSNADETASHVTIAANSISYSGLGDFDLTDPSDGGNGIWLQGGAGTQLTGNAATRSLFTDCRDQTTGGGTLGTANLWISNFGLTSFPMGLCVPVVP